MKRPASLVTTILLFLLAAAQLCRYLFEVKVVAAGVEIPVWFSAIAAIVLTALAVWLLKERNKE